MDIFQTRNVQPMLIAEEAKPFDSPDYIYELKLNGLRCLAYLSPEGTDLRDNRNQALTSIFPELQDIHRQVDGTVILDGELIVMAQGKPDFEKLQQRALMTDVFKIRLSAAESPASFMAFDILYLDGQELFYVPLNVRKRLLSDTVRESKRLAISRVTEGRGVALYDLAEGMDLEGIVAKRAFSFYYPAKPSKDWIKVRYMQEEEFIAAGYVFREGNVISLVLGRQVNGKLQYEGHVSLGVAFSKVRQMYTNPHCPFEQLPPGNENAVWFDVMPLCTVKYMRKGGKCGVRQPVFKGFKRGIKS